MTNNSVPKYLVILNTAQDANKELDPTATPITIDPAQFHGSLHKGKVDADTNCWTSPSGVRFMIRGKNYLKDNMKVDFAVSFELYVHVEATVLVHLCYSALYLLWHI